MRLIAFPVASQGRRSSSHDGRAPGFPARRRSAQRRGNTKCVAVQLCRKWMLRQTRRNPTDECHSHSSSVVFTSRVRLSIQDAPAVARAPLVVAQCGVPPRVVCRSRCQFWHESFTHFAGWFSLFQTARLRCRDRFAFACGASTRRTFSSGDRQLTTGVFHRHARGGATPRGRDHFHARIRARTAYRTAFLRAPRAHAASPSPRASRLVPSRLRPFRPPRISSPRHAR
jgi:hypothetical protein